jgi:stage V sporulation protein D (sporulation-specific penicillin-binding protein)
MVPRRRPRVGQPDQGLGPLARRTMDLAAWSLLALALLAVRLFDIQVVRGPALAAAAHAEHLRVVPLPATRGDIVDRHGDILAVSEPAADVWADPAQVPDKAAAAAALGRILSLGPGTLLRLLERPGQYVMLQRDATVAQGQAVQRLGLPGVYVTPDTVRVYPKGFFLAHILGFVGASGQGLAGVELSYQRALAGQNGYVVEQMGLDGVPLPGTRVVVRPPVPGLTLQLTIDDGLQREAQDLVEQAVASTRAQAAYAIVMRPDDGEILAATSWPTFDPNHFADVPPSVWYNSVYGVDLVPGSVFKPFTVAMALETGVVQPSTPFYDPGYITVDGVTLHNFTTLETHTTFARAFDESANVVFAHVGLAIGPNRFYAYLRAFGLLSPPTVDLPGAQPNVFRPLALTTPLTLAEESFGESLAVTPLNLIDALAAIANGGYLVEPHVGLALLGPDGRVVERIPTRVVRRVISPSVAATVRQMMVGVVDDGTGNRGFIPCYDVAGKTGTANIYGPHGVTNQYIASFVAFAPASHPAAIVLVQLVDPRGWMGEPWMNEGGEVAAPVAQALLADTLHVLGVPPHCTPSNTALPAPGSPGTTSLVLDMVPMPSVVNQTPAAARAAAAAAGIDLVVEGSGPRVLTQDPPPGAMVQRWTTAYAYTDALQAPEPASFVRVPDVAGDTIAQATATLVRAGLALDAQGVGRAEAQDPAPGTLAPPGSGVTVLFGGAA